MGAVGTSRTIWSCCELCLWTRCLTSCLCSSLQLPPAVLHQLDKRRRAFLWSGNKNGNTSSASCLVAWINVYRPKELGGLGIKDMGVQNICLLLKLLHRLHCPNSSAWEPGFKIECLLLPFRAIYMGITGRPCAPCFPFIGPSRPSISAMGGRPPFGWMPGRGMKRWLTPTWPRSPTVTRRMQLSRKCCRTGYSNPSSQDCRLRCGMS